MEQKKKLAANEYNKSSVFQTRGNESWFFLDDFFAVRVVWSAVPPTAG
jgi:hypothetical protein